MAFCCLEEVADEGNFNGVVSIDGHGGVSLVLGVGVPRGREWGTVTTSRGN